MAEPKKYRAAVIGLGQIGSRYAEDAKRRGIATHAAAFAAHPRCTLVAGVDTIAAQRRAFHTRWPDARVYSNAAQMLQTESPDIVSIASSTDTHTEILRTLLRVTPTPRAIFCEKPLAHSLGALKTLLPKLQRTPFPILLNFSRRWDRVHQALAHDIAQKKHGALLHIDTYYTGTLANMACHLIDGLRSLVGDIAWVQSVPPWPARDTDQISALLGFAKPHHPCVAQLHHLATSDYYLFEFDFYFEHARVRLADNGFAPQLWRAAPSPHFKNLRALQPEKSPYGTGYDRVLEHAVDDLVRCIATKKSPRCSVHDGLRALQIEAALIKSAKLRGRKISAN